MSAVVRATLLLVCAGSVEAQRLEPAAITHESAPAKPAAHISASQIVMGTLVSVACGVASWAALDNINDRRVDGDYGYTPNAQSAFAVASYLCSSAFVTWVGSDTPNHGSMTGALVGGAFVALPLLILSRTHWLVLPLSAILFSPLQALSSALGWSLSAKSR